ncbi:MAG: helicase-related protein [bacterium]|nr:helicase-related protein [bacterium]
MRDGSTPSQTTDGFQSLGLRSAYSTSDGPLHSFYIPVLSLAKQIDRSAGYFTSHSLSLAARGLARLIQNNGKMRLLVGMELHKEDVNAVRQGAALEDITRDRLESVFEGPSNDIEERRLEALAWMVAAGTLTIKVVLPRHGSGYFHVKNGIATDHRGDQVSWQGSNNETQAGWIDNFEEFSVGISWDSDWTKSQVRFVEESFRRLWEGRHPKWTTLSIPEAARQKLLAYKTDKVPQRDPEEGEKEERLDIDREAVIAAWLADVPHMLGMDGRLGQTAAVRPWPHQSRVAQDVIATFPQRYLLADEVGLGKTIEVGLILRDLTLSQKVRRCLILAPASVRRQWQGELREKFGMTVPVYDGHDLLHGAGPEESIEVLNGSPPWDTAPIMIMSSQLARRTERRKALWEGPQWDLVVIDEAHHARRKDFLNRNLRRPNRLLELLEGVDDFPGGLTEKTEGLLLLTATPMQVNPVEVWDLLIQLGLPGRWGASGENFLQYFQELRRAPTEWREVNWRLVAKMARDELRHGGNIHDRFDEALEAELGWAGADRLKQLLDTPARIASLREAEQQAALLKMLHHLTPLRRRMHRHTRQLLRTYQEKGLLPDNLAERLPDPRWVEMTPQERSLYDRVEEYISHFYRKYEAERKGLGFVMTVYRRRLTSSFHALEKSLSRRLDFLQGQAADLGITAEDWEDDDLGADVSEDLSFQDDRSSPATQEVEYVQSFLRSLRQLGTDTKYAQLEEDLSNALAVRPNVVIFTQFTDTMDYLREKLSAVYGRRVACYSGRGGERWNGKHWSRVGKEEIKQEFKDEGIQILLGTDAMAEGLNLQTCGVEINYDVPWNPMRLEQRIGRVDRIGQRFDAVNIWSYFLEGTIEAQVYRRLRDRIDWFKGVVGPLQPILHSVEQTIRDLALQSPPQRNVALDAALTKLEAQIEQADEEVFDLESYQREADKHPEPAPPATPSELEAFYTRSHSFGHLLRPDADLDGAYLLEGRSVTFRPELADQHPDTLHFLTLGDEQLAQLSARTTELRPSAFGLRRLETNPGRRRVGWFQNRNGKAALVHSLSELQRRLLAENRQPVAVDLAEQAFQDRVATETSRQRTKSRRIAEEKRSALREKGIQLLEHAICLWLARQQNLFGQGTPRPGSTTLEAMIKDEGYPFAGLARLLGGDVELSPDTRQWEDLTALTDRQLQSQWKLVTARSERLLNRLAVTKT